MNSNYMYQNKKDHIFNIIISTLSTWFLSGGIMNILNIGLDYFTLDYSGTYQLPQQIMITVILFIFISNFLNNYRVEVFNLSSLFFFYTLLLFNISWSLRFGILIVLFCYLFKNTWDTPEVSFSKNILKILIVSLNAILIFFYIRFLDISRLKELFLKTMPLISNNLYQYKISIISVFLINLIAYFIIRNKLELSDRRIFYLGVFVFIFQFLIIGRILFYRYYSLNTPTFDFNLFAQMFYSMDKSLVPMTTLERNMYLSHFNVHISPIFYLLLPFYKLTKDPSTLQLLQGLIVASGIFPFVRIAKQFKIPHKILVFLSFIYLLNPALIVSNFYDLHENAFLVPILLFLLYYIEMDNNIGIAIFTIATLLIKEDAVIYIWTLALYMIIDKKKIKKGLIIAALSSIYFIACLYLLRLGGQGAMIGRFDNFIGIKQLSILSIPITIFKNPGFFFNTIFSENKIVYLLQMLLALSIVPLFKQRYSKYILFIPFIVINLISDYPYQSDIMFQYNYGSTVMLLFLLLCFFSENNLLVSSKKQGTFQNSRGSNNRVNLIPMDFKSVIPALILSISITVSSAITLPYVINYEYFRSYYLDNKESIVKIKQALDIIPEDSSVLASPFLTGYLSRRSSLFDIEYNLIDGKYTKTDFIALDLREGYLEDQYLNLQNFFLTEGYNIVKYEANLVVILGKK